MRLFLLALPLFSTAAGPRCPQGLKPSFTGHPFAPISCPAGLPVARPEPAPDAPAPLPPRDERKLKLEPFAGRWLGHAVFAGSRYEVAAEARQGKGGALTLRVETTEHQTFAKNALVFSLKPAGPGVYAGQVKLESLPGTALAATLKVGSPAAAGEPAFERELLVLYEGRPAHRLRLALEKGKARYEYADLGRTDEPVLGVLTLTPPLSR